MHPIVLALQDDECLWAVPGSHDRPNTEEEEARFEEKRTGWDEMFPGAILVKLRAGSAVPFDSRGIHRGLKRPGTSRRSLFFVYGPTEEAKSSAIIQWAKDPVYSGEEYLASLPPQLRRSIEAATIAAGE
ncbi:MAG: phytanoyl-CoA dioxygenase family protein [Planctomycetota bacterium]|nr:phytanoyl-CoA dioxygenase family protein [Planctomycetota bacterium]